MQPCHCFEAAEHFLNTEATGDMGKLIAVLSVACGEPVAVLKKLGLKDLKSATAEVTKLLGELD